MEDTARIVRSGSNFNQTTRVFIHSRNNALVTNGDGCFVDSAIDITSSLISQYGSRPTLARYTRSEMTVCTMSANVVRMVNTVVVIMPKSECRDENQMNSSIAIP